MSGGFFAGSGLLQRLRSVPVTVADLRRVADEVLPGLATGRLRITLADDRADGAVVVLEEDERRVRTPLRDLAEDMTDARVGSTPEELAAALTAWVRDRPVPDGVAAETGVAVLDWTDRTETAVGGQLRAEGPVALWSHPEVPVLASAVLVAPDLLLDRMAAAGLDPHDPQVVVTPHSPLACAGAAVAARLAGETGEACQRLPWRQIARLRWT